MKQTLPSNVQRRTGGCRAGWEQRGFRDILELRRCAVRRIHIRTRTTQHSQQGWQRVAQSPFVRTVFFWNPHTSSDSRIIARSVSASALPLVLSPLLKSIWSTGHCRILARQCFQFQALQDILERCVHASSLLVVWRPLVAVLCGALSSPSPDAPANYF